MDAPVGLGVEPRKKTLQPAGASRPPVEGIEPRPQPGVRHGPLEDPVAQRPEVEAAAPHHQRDRPAAPDVPYRRSREVRVAPGGTRIVGVERVEEVVRHPRAQLRRGFPGTDIQFPVDLEGVAGDDLDGKRERLRHRYREFRLPAGGRSHERQDQRRVR